MDYIHGHWAHTYPSLNTLLNHNRSLKAHFPDWIPLESVSGTYIRLKGIFFLVMPHTCRQQQLLCVLQKGIKLTIRGYGSCYRDGGSKGHFRFGILLTLAGSEVFNSSLLETSFSLFCNSNLVTLIPKPYPFLFDIPQWFLFSRRTPTDKKIR